MTTSYDLAMGARWSSGDVIVRREELGLQPADVTERTAATGVWLEAPVFVVDEAQRSWSATWPPVPVSDSLKDRGPRRTVGTHGAVVRPGRATAV